MAKTASFVKENSSGTGTASSISLEGAQAGFRKFLDPASISTGDWVHYYIQDGNGTDWERGAGIVHAGTLENGFVGYIERLVIFESTNADAIVSLSSTTPHTVKISPVPGFPQNDYRIEEHLSADSASIATGATLNVSWGVLDSDIGNNNVVPSTVIYVPEWVTAFQVTAHYGLVATGVTGATGVGHAKLTATMSDASTKVAEQMTPPVDVGADTQCLGVLTTEVMTNPNTNQSSVINITLDIINRLSTAAVLSAAYTRIAIRVIE